MGDNPWQAALYHFLHRSILSSKFQEAEDFRVFFSRGSTEWEKLDSEEKIYSI